MSTSQAERAEHRRRTWKLETANTFEQAEEQTRAYRRNASSAERLNALEALREPFYGGLCLSHEVRFMVIGGYAVMHSA